MSLQFFMGVSGSGKSTTLYKHVIEEAILHPHMNYLIIVPDQFTMQTQKDLVMMHPNKGIMNIDVLSFSRLSYRVFEEIGGPATPVLDDTGKSLILRRVAASLEDELLMIGNNMRKIGYIHEVKSAISEFMQYDIKSEQLDKMIQQSEKKAALSYKLKDLKTLYLGFQKYIQDKFITTEETLDFLKKGLSHSELIHKGVVIFDGFTGFTPVQNQVIQELMIQSLDVLISITANPFEYKKGILSEQNLFFLTHKTIHTLEKMAKEAGVHVKEPVFMTQDVAIRFQNKAALAHLEQHLFRYPLKAYKEYQEEIFLHEALSPKEELWQVAVQMKELIRSKQYAYRDMAVVCGDLATYGPKAEEVFRIFQIPCYVDETRQILLNPFIEYIRSGLSMIAKDFSYESVFHFLKSGLCDYQRDEIDILENYVLQFGIRGQKAWNKPFLKKSKQMEEEVLQNLNKIRETMMILVEPLCKKEASMHEYVLLLYDFILKNQIQEKLEKLKVQFEKASDFQKAKEFAQIYRLVMELLEQMDALMMDEVLNLKEFSDILDAGFAEMEVGSIPLKLDLVVVGDIERTRLKDIKVLFFVGLNDGMIPKNAQKGGIISDVDREFLRSDEWELAPTPRQQMFIQKLYLYLNMTKPQDKLILSFSRIDGEGKSLRPAYLVDVIRKLFPTLMIQSVNNRTKMEQIQTKGDGIFFLMEELQSYLVKGLIAKEDEELLLALLSLYDSDEIMKSLLQHMKQAAFFEYTRYPLTKDIATMLYGKILYHSISRIELFAGCEYAHFLQYGLNIQERDTYSFENSDLGNLYHQVLELFARALEEEKLSWFTFQKEDAKRLLSQCVERVTSNYGDTILYSSARYQYAIKRLMRVLERTVDTLQYQLKQGSFKPSQFELSFSLMEDLEGIQIPLSGDEKIILRGRIDRVDTYINKDALYVKVIDYKSGNKDFDLASLYYGLQLQLIVYMNAALQLGKKKYPSLKPIPAGILYYKVDDPLVEMKGRAFSEEERNAEIRKQLKMSGIVNDNPEIVSLLDGSFSEASDVVPVKRNKDGSYAKSSKVFSDEHFDIMNQYVNQKIRQIGQEMLQGQIHLNPYEWAGKSACDYCKFQKVCGFDKKLDGCKKRQLEDLTEDEIFPLIKQELEEKKE